jgi:hypothetical protein
MPETMVIVGASLAGGVQQLPSGKRALKGGWS